MNITLTDGDTTVDLHPDLYWLDEFSYSAVKQTVDPTITGSLVVQIGVMTAGQPITLQNAEATSAWMTRAVVTQLRNWAADAAKELTLTLRGVERTVIFRRQDGALEATPIKQMRNGDEADADPFLCTIRLMEI